MSGSIVLPIVTKYSGKGFKQANTGIHAFKKSVGGLKSVLGGLGLALGAGQLASFGMAAAKAAQADLKSQSLLAEGLKRTTKANKAQIASSESFIQSLSRQSGVLDDELRPALADLARTTHNTKKAQDLLKISLDAATMKGVSTTKVQTAIAKAYNGSTTALSRAFPELKKVQLAYEQQNGKVKNLAAATDVGRLMIKALAKESKGMAAEQATPFDKINVAADDMKEKLGNLILPKLTDFMNDLMKPGGAIDKLGQFLQDSGNPKTDAGRAFREMGDGLGIAATNAKNFLAVFNADSMSGFLDFARRAATVFGIAKGAQGIFKMLGAFGVKGAAGLSTSVAGIALSQYAASETSQANAKAAKQKTGKDFVLQPGGIGQGLPSGLFQPGGMVINVYGKATKADAEEVIRLVRNHERRNGVSWRK
jgi:hypothetical protein